MKKRRRGRPPGHDTHIDRETNECKQKLSNVISLLVKALHYILLRQCTMRITTTDEETMCLWCHLCSRKLA